jgi:hypothetical protein
MVGTMFEKYGFAGAFIQVQAVLTLYAQGLLTGASPMRMLRGEGAQSDWPVTTNGRPGGGQRRWRDACGACSGASAYLLCPPTPPIDEDPHPLTPAVALRRTGTRSPT